MDLVLLLDQFFFGPRKKKGALMMMGLELGFCVPEFLEPLLMIFLLCCSFCQLSSLLLLS